MALPALGDAPKSTVAWDALPACSIHKIKEIDLVGALLVHDVWAPGITGNSQKGSARLSETYKIESSAHLLRLSERVIRGVGMHGLLQWKQSTSR